VLVLACCALAACRYSAQQDRETYWFGVAPQQDAAVPAQQCSALAPQCPAGCPSGTRCGPDCYCTPDVLLAHPSRSTPIAYNNQGTVVAAAMFDGRRVDIFRFIQDGSVFFSALGEFDEPRALAFRPDGSRLLVLDRNYLHQRHVGGEFLGTLTVCAEPTSLVLSPSGVTAYVGCLEGLVVQVDVNTMTLTQVFALRGAATVNGAPLPGNAGVMALAMSNNDDGSDGDEQLVVPLFWAEPVAVASPQDADLAGVGVVALISAQGLIRRVDLLPSPNVGFGVGAFMNQLSAVTVDRGRAYVAALAASPKGPAGPANDILALPPQPMPVEVPAGAQNVFPMVAVLDLATGVETSRININGALAPFAQPFRPDGPAQQVAYLSSISALAFIPGTGELLVLSVASDAMVSLFLDGSDGLLQVGRPTQRVVGLGNLRGGGGGGGGGGYPQPGVMSTGLSGATGLAIPPVGRRVFVLGEITQNAAALTVGADQVSLTSPDIVSAVLVEDNPTARVLRNGKFFFVTSTGRWGNQGMMGCLACHPGRGTLSDNVTWYFSPGPRQTISLESLYGRDDGGMKTLADHRAQTWTANTDEIADLESNTRSVSGGFGALTVMGDVRIDLSPFAGLNASADYVCDNLAMTPDWIEVAEYLRTLRRPQGVQDDNLVAQGRQVFLEGNCAACHGGSKWSSSNVPYDLTATATGYASDRAHFTPYNLDGGTAFNSETLVISGDDTPVDVAAGVPTPALERIACVLRNVGTYFVDGGQSPLEIRGNMNPVNWAQGRAGFNPPPLTGLRYGAPFLHRGQVAQLRDLFVHEAWAVHRTAGNPGFAPTPQQVDALVAFLESIDDDTEPVPPPQGYNYCPRIF